MKPRVRFAPSPTGHVHIGNIRTAIFNWLFARHEEGQFLLRIEDTDLERSTDEAKEALLEVMNWLGLDFDGEPFYQSRQAKAHLAAAEKLKENGYAYDFAKGDSDETATLFRIPVELGGLPFTKAGEEITLELHPDEPVVIDETGVAYALPSKKGKPFPQAGCLAGFQNLTITNRDGNVTEVSAETLSDIISGDTRIVVLNPTSMTFTRWYVKYEDLILGTMSKPIDSIKDFVIVRSDGSPVFHLANVCDDLTQGVTHIIRGNDHVENTYRHLFLFHAIGGDVPAYAHMPMIVNEQGKPYAKRDGDAYVGDFRTKGYLAHALFNYLSLLGWSPGDDREKMSLEELVQAFTINRVKSAPAQMDMRKLDDLNAQYIAEMPTDAFVEYLREHLDGEDKPTWLFEENSDQLNQVVGLMQSRTKKPEDAYSWSYFFSDELSFDEKVVRKNIQKPGICQGLETVLQNLEALKTFDETGVEAAIHAATDACDIKQGKLNQPIRVAVTGTNVGAGIYETLVLLGQDRTCQRLQQAIDQLCLSE